MTRNLQAELDDMDKTSPRMHSLKRNFVYGICSVALMAGVLGLFWLDANSMFRAIAGPSAVFGLLGAFFQLLRDAISEDHSLSLNSLSQAHQSLLQGRDHRFALATSHMSNKAFDNYCEFCDAYLQKLHEVRDQLVAQGSQAAMEGSWALTELQRKWCLWVDNETREKLDTLEFALRSLGADAEFSRATRGTNDPARGPAIQREYAALKSLLGMVKDEVDKESPPGTRKQSLTFEQVIDEVRVLLGLDELTKLRRRIIGEASAELASKRPEE